MDEWQERYSILFGLLKCIRFIKSLCQEELLISFLLCMNV